MLKMIFFSLQTKLMEIQWGAGHIKAGRTLVCTKWRIHIRISFLKMNNPGNFYGRTHFWSAFLPAQNSKDRKEWQQWMVWSQASVYDSLTHSSIIPPYSSTNQCEGLKYLSYSWKFSMMQLICQSHVTCVCVTYGVWGHTVMSSRTWHFCPSWCVEKDTP